MSRDISTWEPRPSVEDIIGVQYGPGRRAWTPPPGRRAPAGSLIVLHRTSCPTLRTAEGQIWHEHPRFPYTEALDLIQAVFELYGAHGVEGRIELCQNCAIGPQAR